MEVLLEEEAEPLLRLTWAFLVAVVALVEVPEVLLFLLVVLRVTLVADVELLEEP